jgi:hypothetical protein
MVGMKRPIPRLLSIGGLVLGLSAPAVAQEPVSAAPAKELSQLLAGKKLDSVAARLPGAEDEFAAALAFPGQIVVVWARFSAPRVLNEKLLNRSYREVYIDLNSASEVATRHFVTDFGADGLRNAERNSPSDSHDVGDASMRFDGNWREDKMSESEYMKLLAEADSAYAKVLGVLIEEIKKGG